MIIHGAKPSPFVRKTLAVLEEKGVDYELRSLAPIPKTPELMAMNPAGKIPILEHDGAFIPDSSVICAYLERLHPEPAMYPKDPRDFARALFIEEYADTIATAAVGTIFFERFVKKNIFQQEPDEAAVQTAIDEALPPVLEYFESQVPGAGTILADFSIADAALAGNLGSLVLVGVDIDAGKYPKLAEYTASILERPSVKTGLDL